MHRILRALLLIALLGPPAHACAELPAPAAPSTPLTLRTYAANDLDRPSSETMTIAASMLAQAGISTRWTFCGIHDRDAGCAQPITTSELAMRLLREKTPPPASRPQAMGSSFVDTARRAGSFATLYLNRIEMFAASSGVTTTVLLARALVHEATHLVLGTNDHGSTGLMRPLWTREMLRTNPDSDWALTHEEAERMREALTTRVTSSAPNATK